MNVAGYCGRRRRQKRVNISVGESTFTCLSNAFS